MDHPSRERRASWQYKIPIESALNLLGLNYRAVGQEAAVNCPFHEDKTPSMSVNLDSGLWFCHGCKEKGNLTQLWARRREIPVAEAKDELRSIAGDTRKPQAFPTKDEREQWHRDLAHERPCKYLKDHAISLDYARECGWGYDIETDALKILVFNRRRDGILQVKTVPLGGGHKTCLAGRGSSYYPLWMVDDLSEMVVCEGEGDAIALHSIKVNAITHTVPSAMKGSRLDSFDSTSTTRSIALCFDNDQRGEEYRQKLTEQLTAKGVQVRNIVLPAEFNDIAEFLASHDGYGAKLGAWEKLSAAASISPAREAKGAAIVCDRTELGNAGRIVREHGDIIRWVPDLQCWFGWTGTHWQRVSEDDISALAVAVCEDLRDEAERLEAEGLDDKAVDTARKFYGASATARGISSMIKLTKSLRTDTGDKISMPVEAFDNHPFLLNTQNGTVDLETGELRPARADDYLTDRREIYYRHDATCPLWEQTIAECTSMRDGTPDPETASYLQRAIGYCMTGDVREQVVFLMYGLGGNGKSLVMSIIQQVLGPLQSTLPMEMFVGRGDGRDEYYRATMKGKRLICAHETGRSDELKEGFVKSITGGDEITARVPAGRPFTFSPTHKLLLSFNHRPVIQGGDHGIWRRIRLIPFEMAFDGQDGRPAADPLRAKRLRAELPGILRWMVEGAVLWRKHGLEAPTRCAIAAEEYREDMDESEGFFDLCLEHSIDDKLRLADLRRAFDNFCRTQNVPTLPAGAHKRFKAMYQERGYRSRTVNGTRYVADARFTREGKAYLMQTEEIPE